MRTAGRVIHARSAVSLLVVLIVLFSVAAIAAEPQSAPAQSAATAPAAPAPYSFAAGSGLLVFHVAPAKVADFEAILGRLKEALAKADSPARKLQASHWEIFKSTEAPVDAQVFLFFFNPVVKDANYDPLLLLAEVLPGEVQAIYARLKEAVVKVEKMGLSRIR